MRPHGGLLAETDSNLLATLGASLLFAALCYPALGAFFTADDFILLQRSTAKSTLEAFRFFLTDWGGGRYQGGYYRPVVNLTLAFDQMLYGLWAPGYRLTNILIHWACVLVLFHVCRRRLDLPLSQSRAAAAFFLLHPLHDQAVLWIAGRTDLLCTLFFLGAFYLALDDKRHLRYLGGLLFTLSLASKEMAVTFPFVLIAFEIARDDGSLGSRLRRGARRAGPFLCLLILYVIWRASIIGGIGGDSAFRTWGLAVIKSTAKLLQWLFVPWELTALKAILRQHPAFLYVISVLWLLVLIVAAYIVKGVPLARFAAGWVLITLLPVHGRPQAWYLYLPSVGAVILLAVLLHTWLKRPAAQNAATVIVSAAFGLTLQQNAQVMASAGVIARDAVRFFSDRPTPTFLINAPIALRGRIPILTSMDQYNAALALFASGQRVIPLNYVYIASATDPRTLTKAGRQALELSVDTGPDTFFTLDGVISNPPPAPRPGVTLRGDYGTYLVAGLDAQGKISHLNLTDLPMDFGKGLSCLSEFRQGQFGSLYDCAIVK